MSDLNITDTATQQLDRVLGFFPRVEGKASLIFAVNTATLALVALNLKPLDIPYWYIAGPAALAILFAFVSIYFCYRCVFPSLEGGESSLIYFRQIATRTETNFIDEFSDLTSEKYNRDLMAQIWRNSQILAAKFDSIKKAFISTGLSLVPWLAFLAASAIAHSQIPLIH